MLALGYLGLGEPGKATRYLDEVGVMDIKHQGIQMLRAMR